MAGNIDSQFADFLGDTEAPAADTTRPDGRLLRIPLKRLSPNGVNPRVDFGTAGDLLDFGKSLVRHQNQACPVVSRRAYLKLWPDHAQRVGDVDYVLVCGERRYRAATEVGMAALQCVVDDNVASSRKKFMEAVISENIDRRNFDPIEEANAVAAMAAEFDSNVKVAEHFERAGAWVTQRINLTYLDAGIQDRVRSKEIPLEDARTLGQQVKTGAVSATFEGQLAWWEARKDEKARQAADRQAAKAAKKAAAKQAVKDEKTTAAGQLNADSETRAPEAPSFTAVKPPADPDDVGSFHPAPRSEGTDSPEGAVAGPPPGEPAAPEPAGVPAARTGTNAAGSSGNGHQEELATAGTGQAGRGEAAPAAQPEAPQMPEFLARPKMPWHDGSAVADIVTSKMPVEQQRVLLQRLQALLVETAAP